MNYDKLSEDQKKKLIITEYQNNRKSFRDIAEQFGTYANKIRRDAKKYNISIRVKPDRQKPKKK